jgi:mannitol-specific phosphotransferase system IIBC component
VRHYFIDIPIDIPQKYGALDRRLYDPLVGTIVATILGAGSSAMAASSSNKAMKEQQMEAERAKREAIMNTKPKEESATLDIGVQDRNQLSSYDDFIIKNKKSIVGINPAIESSGINSLLIR